MDFEKICTACSFLAAFRPEEFMLNISVCNYSILQWWFSDVNSRVSVLPGSETVQSAFPRGYHYFFIHVDLVSIHVPSFHSFHSLFSHLLFYLFTH